MFIKFANQEGFRQMIQWSSVDEREYMEHASQITVIWVGSFSGKNISFRKTPVCANVDFISLLGNAYLPWYYNNLGGDCNYNHPGAKNYTVDQWVNKHQVGQIRNKQQPIVILTVLDTGLGKRLIIDGCKRSVALVKYGFTGIDVSGFLFEAYGDSIRHLFCADFASFQKTTD
jgi:hypothetical protein